jgi:hypothetical protein
VILDSDLKHLLILRRKAMGASYLFIRCGAHAARHLQDACFFWAVSRGRGEVRAKCWNFNDRARFRQRASIVWNFSYAATMPRIEVLFMNGA